MSEGTPENSGVWYEPQKEGENPCTILYLEDDPGMATFFTTVMGKMGGYRVLHVDDGGKGLEALQAGGFDLVVTDNHMIEMDGNTMVPLARQINADIPIIMLSGESNPDEIANLFANGLTQFLCKPCLPRTLLSAIEEALENKS